MAGVEHIQGFDARDMFSEVFRSRKDDDVEDYFAVGTSSTTPPLTAVDTNWPKPWAFFKTFTLSVIVCLAFVFAVQEFHNPKLVPGLIMTGAFLIPMSLLIFFGDDGHPKRVLVTGCQTDGAGRHPFPAVVAISFPMDRFEYVARGDECRDYRRNRQDSRVLSGYQPRRYI